MSSPMMLHASGAPLVAPPLGHIPPPPPRAPPPFLGFYSLPSTSYSSSLSSSLIETPAATSSYPSTASSSYTHSSQIASTENFPTQSTAVAEQAEQPVQEPVTRVKSAQEKEDSGLREARKQAVKIKFGNALGFKRSGDQTANVPAKSQRESVQRTKRPKVEKKISSEVAKAFGSDSEDDDEEMPREARLRMRNLGKDTPTSSGPNSFGKTARGFTDTVGVYKREQTWS